MTRPELTPDLERLGDALRAGATTHLAREQEATERRTHRRPRLLAGGTLGLAGIGAALTLALSGAASSPAFAVTRLHNGTVRVKILRPSGVAGANRALAAMGIHDRVTVHTHDKRLLVACLLPAPEHGTPEVYTPRPGPVKRLTAKPLPAGTVAGNTGGTPGPVPTNNTGSNTGNTGSNTGNTGNTGPGSAVSCS